VIPLFLHIRDLCEHVLPESVWSRYENLVQLIKEILDLLRESYELIGGIYPFWVIPF